MKKISVYLIIAVLGFSLVSSPALAVVGGDQLSQASGSSSASVAKTRSAVDKQLDNRIEDLGKLLARINEFKNISGTDKSAMVAIVNGLISNLSNLREEIDSTSSTTVISNARESVSKYYRVYGLIMPQLNIVGAADRMTTSVSAMLIVASKLEMRLNSLATSSQITQANITSAQNTLNSLKDKLVDAQRQAQEAVSLVAPLVPDQGDKATMTSNLAAIKEARVKIRQTFNSLIGAKNDATTIMKLLAKADKDPGQATSTAPAETN